MTNTQSAPARYQAAVVKLPSLKQPGAEPEVGKKGQQEQNDKSGNGPTRA